MSRRLKYIIGIVIGIPAAFYAILNIWTFFRPDPGCSLFRPKRERIPYPVPLNLQQSQHLGDVWTNATGSDAALKLQSACKGHCYGGNFARLYASHRPHLHKVRQHFGAQSNGSPFESRRRHPALS